MFLINIPPRIVAATWRLPGGVREATLWCVVCWKLVPTLKDTGAWIGFWNIHCEDHSGRPRGTLRMLETAHYWRYLQTLILSRYNHIVCLYCDCKEPYSLEETQWSWPRSLVESHPFINYVETVWRAAGCAGGDSCRKYVCWRLSALRLGWKP